MVGGCEGCDPLMREADEVECLELEGVRICL